MLTQFGVILAFVGEAGYHVEAGPSVSHLGQGTGVLVGSSGVPELRCDSTKLLGHVNRLKLLAEQAVQLKLKVGGRVEGPKSLS